MTCLSYTKSLLTGGPIAYLISTLILLENLITLITFPYLDYSLQDIFTHFRISIALILILIHGVSKSSFIVVIFSRDINDGLFICWCMHTFSFLVFFLNVLWREELFFYMNFTDIVFKLFFYGVLLSNCIFFLFFMLFVIVLSILIIFFPNLRNRFQALNEINDFLNNMEQNDENPINRPLNQIELNELNSFDYNKSCESLCVICFNDKKSKEKVIKPPNCDHSFHSHCIKQWFQNKPVCPVCKSNVRNLNDQEL